MRSHAKASTAGSTQRQAKGLGRIFGGALATRDGLSDAKGSGAPKGRRYGLPLALLVAVFSLALGVSSALAVAPTIVSTSVSAVTSKAAVLEARINPEGEATTYHFEYGTADCASNPCTSTPNAGIGSGSSAVKVAKEIAGLNPGTTYHFRVVASNGSGPSSSMDRTFNTYETAVPASNCPNQEFRIGASAALPDCRAYEMVSPVDKNGGEIKRGFNSDYPGAGFYQATPSGEKLAFTSTTSFGDQPSSQNANQYIGMRGAQGWSTDGINPLLTPLTIPYAFLSPYVLHRTYQAFSEDLTSGWLLNDNEPPLAPGGVAGFLNLYRYHSGSDSYEPLTLNPPSSYNKLGLEPIAMELEFKGASADSTKSVYQAQGALTPNAAASGQYQVYAFSDGQVHLVSVLPDGTANTAPSVVGQLRGLYGYFDTVDRAVSKDGARVFWTSVSNPQGAGPGKIYVRKNPLQPQSAISGGECTEPAKACTIAVSESVTTQNSQFWTASTDGSKAVFEVQKENDPLDQNLYVFDVEAETATLVAGKVGGVVGASEDLSYLYFVSKENLDAGATAGEQNLYLDQGGTIEFIATVSTVDMGVAIEIDNPHLATPVPVGRNTRVTPDGRHLVFMSTESLTGYDNTDAVGASPKSLNGNADFEVFLYDADSDELTCPSCNPSGARPLGQAYRRPFTTFDNATSFFHANTGVEYWTAAWIPGWENEFHPSRILSDDGNRLFFNSFDALVPQDTNGIQDVYQWEAQGTGSCQKAAGCIDLISTGQSPKLSEFLDASADGGDVFIRTLSSIDPRDPGVYDIYDARVDGGYPLPPMSPACLGDACQSVPPAPNDPTPASASFKGAGNPAPRKARKRCRTRHRKAGRSSKASAKRKQAKRKSCRRAKRGVGR